MRVFISNFKIFPGIESFFDWIPIRILFAQIRLRIKSWVLIRIRDEFFRSRIRIKTLNVSVKKQTLINGVRIPFLLIQVECAQWRTENCLNFPTTQDNQALVTLCLKLQTWQPYRAGSSATWATSTWCCKLDLHPTKDDSEFLSLSSSCKWKVSYHLFLEVFPQ